MLDRRAFLGRLGVAAATMALPRRLFAFDDGAESSGLIAPVRARGRVLGDGRPLAGVAVSDGIQVTRTAADGTYDLVAGPGARFLFVTVPAGYAVPTGPSGTARFFAPLRGGASGEMEAGFELARGDDDHEHGFLLLADPQTLDAEDMARFRNETIPDVRRTASMERVPLFGVSCGDLMFDDLSLLPDYEEAVSAAGVPFFQVIGNHDSEIRAKTDEASARTFERRFGPSWYSFERGEIHYVVLDDVLWFGDYIGYIDDTQLRWLRADLAGVEKGRSVVVFAHIPVFCRSFERKGEAEPHPKSVVTNREALYEILAPYRATVITGHMHESEYLEDGGVEIHVVGAVCGAWWSGDICYDGTPNGYGVYRAKGSDLSWRYQATGKDPGHAMRLYAPGTDDEAPAALIANVWGADARWKVEWSQDGRPMGPLAPRFGKDPLAVRLHTGPDLPRKHPWVEPVFTNHLYHAVPSASARRAAVTATDRWGRVYREEITL